MSERPPEFRDLVDGDDLDEAERARLRAVHDLLVAAGPPPDLSPELREAPVQAPHAFPSLRRYRSTLLAAAAALALALFAGGYALGRASGPDEAYRVAMEGAGGSSAQLVVYDADDAGNWPMELRVTSVTALREGALYELWLTKDGKPAAQCGAFLARAGRTVVPLNAPFRLRQFDGWIVVPAGSQDAVLWTEGAA